MGAKKKARSRRKEAIKDACMVDSVLHDKENKGHLYQPGDDLERFLVHIHTCKKQNSRRMERFMPTLFRHLEQGKVTAEEIVKDVMAVYDSKFHNIQQVERIAIMTKLRMAAKP